MSDTAASLSATSAMPAPHSDVGRRVRDRLLAALFEHDLQGAWEALMRCGWEVEAQDRVRSAWLPCLAGCEELRECGRPMPRESVLLRCVQDHVRGELGRLPPEVRPLWVVPATHADDAMAHLTAAILSQRGRIARPWLWHPLPSTAPYLTVGDRPPAGIDAFLHAGHVTLHAHDVFWDVTRLVDGPLALDGLHTGSRRLRAQRAGQEASADNRS